jgi:hypothetical protein
MCYWAGQRRLSGFGETVKSDGLAKNPKTRHPPTQHQKVTEGAGVGKAIFAKPTKMVVNPNETGHVL